MPIYMFVYILIQAKDLAILLQTVQVNIILMFTAYQIMLTYWYFKLRTMVITHFDQALDLGLSKLFAKR